MHWPTLAIVSACLTVAGGAAAAQPGAVLLDGRVRLPDATPAPEAQVLVLRAAFDGNHFRVHQDADLRTGPDGAFRVELPPATDPWQALLMLVARQPPHALAWRAIGLGQPAAASQLELKLERSVPFTGTVVDPAGVPAAGARVEAAFLTAGEPGAENPLLPGGALDYLRTVADAQGRFRLDSLPQGTRLLLHAEADGYGEAWLPGAQIEDSARLLPVGGEPVRVTLGPEARLAGRVRRGADGPGVTDATVLLSLGPRGLLSRRTRTGPDGAFAFTGLTDGIPYVLQALDAEPGPKGVAAPVTITLARGEMKKDADLVLTTPAQVRLRILTDTGDPVAGASLLVRQVDSQQMQSQAADDHGDVLLSLTPGEWRVDHVYFAGGFHNKPEMFRAEAGQTLTREIRIPGFRACEGVVRDAAGAPVPGVQVTVSPGGSGPPTATAADGTFRCTRFEADTARNQPAILVAQDAAHGLIAMVPLPGRGTRAELVLRPGYTLTAHFRRQGGEPPPAARVTVEARFGGTSALLRTETLAEGSGRIELAGLPLAAECLLSLITDGHGPVCRQVEAQTAAGRVELPELVLVPANLAVAGVVREADGTPVVTASVEASGDGQPSRCAQTDTEGRFRIQGLCAGTVRLTATVFQDTPRSTSLDVVAGTADAVLTFKPVEKIGGTVRDEGGSPVAGAAVHLLPFGGRPVTTDAEGHFSLRRQERQPGTDPAVGLAVRHDARALAAVVEPVSTQLSPDVVLKPAIQVTLRVLDEAAAPLPAVGVAMLLRGDTWTVGLPGWPAATTDADGRATLKCVPTGVRVLVQASREGLAPAQHERVFEPAAAPVALPDLVLRRADRKVTGIVTDAGGEPITGAWVQVTGEGQPSRQAQTDAAGRFEINGLCAGTAKVTLWYSGDGMYANLTTDLDPAATDVTLRMDKLRAVSGRVRDAAGTAATGVKARLLPVSSETVTAADGTFRLRWSTDQFGNRVPAMWVAARDEARDLAGIAPAPPDAADCDVTLTPALTVKGRVADDAGQPVPEATVWLSLRLQPDRDTSLVSTRTGPDGGYLLRAVPTGYAGAVNVTGSTHGQARAQVPASEAAGAGPVTAEVPLLTVRRATLTVAGLVVDENGQPTAGVDVQLQGGDQPFQATKSDADGHFRFAYACPGPVMLHAYAHGRTFRHGTAEGQGGDQDLQIDLEPQNNQGAPAAPAFPVPVLGQDFDPAKAFYWRDFETDEYPVEWSPAEGMRIEVDGKERGMLGRFTQDTAVTLTLTGLPTHRYIRIYFELYCLLSWDGSHSGFGPDLMDIRLLDGPRLVFASFANWDCTQSYPMPFRLGGVGPGCGGKPFELAATIRNGEPWTRHAVYPMCFLVPHTGDTLGLGFAGIGLGGEEDECWALDSVGVQLLDSAPEVTVSAEDLARAWDDLGRRDVAKAWPAMVRLAEAGERGAEFLLGKLGWADDPELRANALALTAAFATDDRLTWADALAECAKLPVRAQPLLSRHLDARRFGPNPPTPRLAEAMKALWPRDIRGQNQLRQARAAFLLERGWTAAARRALFLDSPRPTP